GTPDSQVMSESYTIIPAETPTANIRGGTVTSGTTVELSTSTVGATIYYTTDGSTPSNASIPYTSPISVTSNITIKAIAVKAGTPDSQVMSESYTIIPAETPTANIRGGTVTSGTTITLSTATVGATIYYTTDGSTPSNASIPYTSPISVTSNITIKAIAVKAGTPDSQVMSESYTIMPAETPTANIRGGTVTSGTTITLSTATVGATIYYTTDGSTPSNTSTPYTSPISVTSDMTIKAIAIKVGIPNSPIMSESYTLLPAGTSGLNPSPPSPSPSHQILIQRVVENGEISYLGNVTLENVQAIIQQLTSEKERVVGVIFPAEAANVDTTLTVQRAAVEYLAKQKVDLFIQLANATIRVPHTSLNDFTDNLFFRIAPIEQTERKVIEENAAQNQKVQDFITNKMSVNLLGDTVAIKTNLQSRPVIVTLPIPADATEEQIASLVVYIEHSNGTAEVKRGRIVEFEPGVKGFQFEVDHFSTFSLLYTSEAQDEEVNRLAPYIQGYPDGSFKPNAPVTRAQMATMLARFLTNGDIPTTMNSSFKDTIYHHSKDAIEVVKQTGLFNGTTETTFNPNGTITRAQMATVVTHWLETGCVKEPSKIICHVSGKAKSYTDVSSTHWAASAIEQVSESGIMTGNSETTFNPNGSLTRAQAVKVLNQLFERPVLEDIPMSTFSDVPSTHWAIGEIESAATERIVNK
ncbi:chitobiase/beta-hexosaminidase C-terminal domain-containing protein, partial [Lysinibacillus sp. NPDC097162]|uniref:chitobiase/beta-hexosaminidase C-terminal domain-containing protein n=1 Tax=Lysinibacillus sp. NPDC097162 TaxID=3364140 RepID=UPI003807E5B3